MIAHRAIAAFARDAGSLGVASIPVDRLAERVGSTGFFAYDRGMLTRRIELLRGTLPPGIDLSYAIKANPMPAVVQHLSGLVASAWSSAATTRSPLLTGSTMKPPRR